MVITSRLTNQSKSPDKYDLINIPVNPIINSEPLTSVN